MTCERFATRGLLVAGLVVVLAACGSDDDDSGAADPGTSISGSAMPSEPTSTVGGGSIASTNPPAATTESAPASQSTPSTESATASGRSPVCEALDGAEPLTVTYQPSSEGLSQITFNYAYRAGLFDSYGLELEYLPINQDSAQIAATIAAGQADISTVGTSGLIAALNAGRDVAGIAIQLPSPPYQVTLTNDTIASIEAESGVTADSPIADRVAALKGLTLTPGTDGTLRNILFRALANEYGVDPDADIELIASVDGEAAVGAARAGEINGFFHEPPNTLFPASEGWGEVWISWNESPSPVAGTPFENVPVTATITSRGFIEENPDAVTRFLCGMWDAAVKLEVEPATVSELIRTEVFPDFDPGLWTEAFDTVSGFYNGLLPTEEGLSGVLEVYGISTGTPVEFSMDEVYALDLTEQTMPPGFQG